MDHSAEGSLELRLPRAANVAGNKKREKPYGKLPPLVRRPRPVVKSPVEAGVTATALPVGWESVRDEETGEIYYVTPDGEVEWELPSTVASAPVASALPVGWESVKDEETGEIYYTTADGEVEWELPVAEGSSAAVVPGSNTARIEPANVSVASPPKVEVNTTDEEKIAQLTELLRTYEIRPDFLQRLLQLDEYEIVFILDNSGSMEGHSDAKKPSGFTKPWTRWEELKYITKILIPIANVFDTNGVDIYLFDEIINNYKDAMNFDNVAGIPRTGTPLTQTLNRVLGHKEGLPAGKKLLIFIVTDGQPEGGPAAFKEALIKKGGNVHVSILACNSDEGAIGYLNDIDETVDRVDCVDDYTREQQDILFVQDEHFPFSYGDYIIKALLGSVDPDFDNLDEKNLLTGIFVVKDNQHHSASRGNTSLRMLSDIRRKWKIGDTLALKTPNVIKGPPIIDTVKITLISKDGKKVDFQPPLQHNHFNYETECLPGSSGCLPFWGGRTRRRSNKSKAKQRSNKSKAKRRV